MIGHIVTSDPRDLRRLDPEVDLRSQPCGYLEGWYIVEETRRSGIGRRLLSAA